MKTIIARLIGYHIPGLFLLAGIFVYTPAFGETEGYTADDCMECHRSGSEESALHISPENYDDSVHGQAVTCQECHTGITSDAHMDGEGLDPVDCSGCHEMKTQKNNLISRVLSFQIASHRKANFTNIYEMDNCLGCHQGTGSHGETEPVNDQDCYKCHDPNIKAAMWGYMHPDTKQKALPVVLAQMCFAAFALILLLGRFLMPVLNDFSKNKVGRNDIDKLN